MGTLNYKVECIISNKSSIRDPEGETILRDLVMRRGYENVKGIRTAKLLQLEVSAPNKESAEKLVMKMCDDLRIYNPVVSICQIRISGN
ncbi:MAG TPA: phosphoribosylformylglycinamidine synthase subunit PurS [Nitrososphaerales archaeon]